MLCFLRYLFLNFALTLFVYLFPAALLMFLY